MRFIANGLQMRAPIARVGYKRGPREGTHKSNGTENRIKKAKTENDQATTKSSYSKGLVFFFGNSENCQVDHL